MLKRVFRHPSVLAAIAWLIGLYLAFVFRTTRWRMEGQEHLSPHILGVPLIITFWHERLALMPMLWVMASTLPDKVIRPRAVHVLVSRHRDGQFIGNIIRRFKLDVVLGSSSAGGPGALRGMVRLLKDGCFVVITPDGPRGPARQAAPGVAQLAALADAVVLPCAAQTTRHRRIGTWDRMIVPWPFGRGVIICEPIIRVPRAGWEASLPAINAALDAAAARADAACR